MNRLVTITYTTVILLTGDVHQRADRGVPVLRADDPRDQAGRDIDDRPVDPRAPDRAAHHQAVQPPGLPRRLHGSMQHQRGPHAQRLERVGGDGGKLVSVSVSVFCSKILGLSGFSFSFSFCSKILGLCGFSFSFGFFCS